VRAERLADVREECVGPARGHADRTQPSTGPSAPTQPFHPAIRFLAFA
jgi:hypothetical protein